MKKLVMAVLLLASCISHADIRPGNPPPPPNYGSSDLTQRVLDLERSVYDLNRRLVNLEQMQGGGRPDPYQKELACMVIADNNSNAYLGKGRTRLDAEAAALQSCQKSVPGVFCKKVTCDDPQQSRNIRGAVCVVNASNNNTTYKGEGLTLIEAEYNARKACQERVPGVFCSSNVPVRCDTY